MPFMDHKYFHVGQSIRLCDETTGHAVKDIAFCESEVCAKMFCEMLNKIQKIELDKIEEDRKPIDFHEGVGSIW